METKILVDVLWKQKMSQSKETVNEPILADVPKKRSMRYGQGVSLGGCTRARKLSVSQSWRVYRGNAFTATTATRHCESLCTASVHLLVNQCASSLQWVTLLVHSMSAA